MKTLAVAMLSLALLAFAACGSQSDAPAGDTTTPAAPQAADATAPSADAPADTTAMADQDQGQAMAHHDEGAVDPAQPVVLPGEAKMGDTTTCPVSKEKFVVNESSPHADYQGKTYYFCCPGCKGKFEKEPAKYLTAQ